MSAAGGDLFCVCAEASSGDAACGGGAGEFGVFDDFQFARAIDESRRGATAVGGGGHGSVGGEDFAGAGAAGGGAGDGGLRGRCAAWGDVRNFHYRGDGSSHVFDGETG